MFKRGRAVRVGALAVTAALVFASCGSDEGGSGGSGGGDSSEPWKIGVILALSGASAQPGQHERDGAESAAKAINAAGGIHGRKIELVVRDDEANPNAAVSAFNGLARDESIVGIFGSTFGSATLAFKPLLEREQIPVIAPNSTYEVTNPQSEWLFRDIIAADVEVDAAVGALKDAGVQSVAILHTTDAYGAQGAKLFQESSGLKVTGTEEMEPDATDVTTQLTKLRSSKPDALVIWGTTPNSGIAIKNAGQIGWDVPIASGDAGPTPGNLEAAAGSSALKSWLNVGLVDPANPLPRQEEGIKNMTTDNPDYPPDVYEVVGYDGIMLLAEALEAAGPGADRAALRDAIEAIQGYEGVAGIYSYGPDNHNGAGTDSVVWLEVKGDTYARVDDPTTVLKR